MLKNLSDPKWIKFYILWELNLIKELGFEINFSNNINSKKNKSFVELNNNKYKIPKIIYTNASENIIQDDIKEALIFNKKLFIENFFEPNKIKLPLYRNLLENYFS